MRWEGGTFSSFPSFSHGWSFFLSFFSSFGSGLRLGPSPGSYVLLVCLFV